MSDYTLFTASLVSTDGPASAAGLLAQRFESDLAAQGWRSGTVFGPEQQLADQYHSSPYLVRQALRILEGRGVGRMRRGAAGGLVLQIPTERVTAHSMSLYLAGQGVTAVQVRDAHRTTRAELKAGLPSSARALTEGLMGELSDCFAVDDDPSSVVEEGGSNRAMRIARRILRDAVPAARQSCGESLLGTIDGLCEIYSAGRPVMTQVVRLLEDLEMLTPVRGRSGGLKLRLPSHSMIGRMTFSHFAARHVDFVQASDVIWAINRASAMNSADRRPDDTALLRELRDQILAEDFVDKAPWSQVALFRYLADTAGDPVLHMMVRCMFTYKIRAGIIKFGGLERPQAARVADATRAIADAVLEKRSDRADQAVQGCRAFLAEALPH